MPDDRERLCVSRSEEVDRLLVNDDIGLLARACLGPVANDDDLRIPRIKAKASVSASPALLFVYRYATRQCDCRCGRDENGLCHCVLPWFGELYAAARMP